MSVLVLLLLNVVISREQDLLDEQNKRLHITNPTLSLSSQKTFESQRPHGEADDQAVVYVWQTVYCWFPFLTLCVDDFGD